MKVSRSIGIAAFLFTAVSYASDPSAAQLFRDAQRAEKAGQVVKAYLLYAEAASKDPSNVSYWTHAQALRPTASMANPDLAHVLGEKAAVPKGQLDDSILGTISEADIQDAKRHPLPPTELKAAPGNKDFKVRGDSKMLWEQVAAGFNLMVVFDSAYQPVQNVRFEISDMGYREALRSLESATNSFVVPVADKLILVANDTTQKRQELESTAAVVLPIPDPFTVQEVQEIGTGIRGTLEIQRLMIDTARRLVVIRDRVWKVRAAEMLLHDLMQPRPQVAIEIEILATDETKNKTWGVDLPTEFPLVNFGNLPRKLISSASPAGFANFLVFGGGATFLGLGLTSATIFAEASHSNSTTLLKSEVVTSDGAPVSFHSGQKYPVVTGSYIASTGASGGYIPPPQFNFEDLGLILKITPHVHGTEEMTLDVSAEFKLLGAGSFNGIPVIASRKLESKVRLMNGEWAVVAGLMTKTEMKSVTGIPILMAIPFLRKNTNNEQSSQTMVILKPHLLNLPPSEARTHTDWIGTETRPRSL